MYSSVSRARASNARSREETRVPSPSSRRASSRLRADAPHPFVVPSSPPILSPASSRRASLSLSPHVTLATVSPSRASSLALSLASRLAPSARPTDRSIRFRPRLSKAPTATTRPSSSSPRDGRRRLLELGRASGSTVPRVEDSVRPSSVLLAPLVLAVVARGSLYVRVDVVSIPSVRPSLRGCTCTSRSFWSRCVSTTRRVGRVHPNDDRQMRACVGITARAHATLNPTHTQRHPRVRGVCNRIEIDDRPRNRRRARRRRRRTSAETAGRGARGVVSRVVREGWRRARCDER